MKQLVRIAVARRPTHLGVYSGVSFPLPYTPTPTTPFPSPCSGCPGCRSGRRRCGGRKTLGQAEIDLTDLPITPDTSMPLTPVLYPGGTYSGPAPTWWYAQVPAMAAPAAASASSTPWLEQELIPGVANKWLLGGGAGIFLLASLRKGKRRR